MVGRCISPRSVCVDVQAREMGRRQHRGTGEVQQLRSVSTGTRNLARSRIRAFYISKPIACVPGRPIISVNLRHCRHDGCERSQDLHCVYVLPSVATRTTGPTEQLYDGYDMDSSTTCFARCIPQTPTPPPQPCAKFVFSPSVHGSTPSLALRLLLLLGATKDE